MALMTHVPWHPEDIANAEELHGIESLQLVSVGIDIGTTTTQLMISRMEARRKGGEYSSKFEIVDREVVYESPILLTPYRRDDQVDADVIEEKLNEWYDEAGFAPDQIDTGAVIITGKANRTENAGRIIELFSETSGKFVCATAGANLETLMAAHGSGAVDHSLQTGTKLLHVDIGGGTTKLATIDEGFVEETLAINLGARLVELDENGEISKIEDAAETIATRSAVDLKPGARFPEEDRSQFTEKFAEILLEVIGGNPSELAESLLVTDMFTSDVTFDAITFSGGVAEYIYGRETRSYNDLGREYGAALRDILQRQKIPIDELSAGIRATAIGSNQHTVQFSGNTILVSDDRLLPLRNVPMVPFVVDHHQEEEEIRRAIHEKLDMYDVDMFEDGFAFGFHLHGLPTYQFLRRLTEAIGAGWADVDGRSPVIVAFDEDVAMNVGNLLEDTIDAPVISIDGVELDQFGYLDIGESIEHTGAVPVTIKSLLFEG